MKKLFIATAVVALFTACHSTTESNVQTADSTNVTIDTLSKLADSTSSDTIIVDTIK